MFQKVYLVWNYGLLHFISFYNYCEAFYLYYNALVKCKMFWKHFAVLDKIKRPLYEKHPMTKYAWTMTEETDTVSTPYNLNHKTVLFYPLNRKNPKLVYHIAICWCKI